MEKFTHLGYTVNIVPDNDSDSPLDWHGSEAVLVSYHRRYRGYRDDEYRKLEPEEAEAKLKRDGYVPYKVFMYEHSGTCYKVADHNPFHCKWDSGWFGWIGLKPSLVNMKGKCKALRTLAEGMMDNYTTWANGGVIGYEVTDDEGEVIDSCYGYYDEEYLKSDAKSFIETIPVSLLRKREMAFEKEFSSGVPFEEDFREHLIEEALKQIKIDVESGDVTGIEGLLETCSNKNLANFLPEIGI